jgi:hypothetical protein
MRGIRWIPHCRHSSEWRPDEFRWKHYEIADNVSESAKGLIKPFVAVVGGGGIGSFPAIAGGDAVRHGHVGRLKDWPYSSNHRMVRQGVYPMNWAVDASGEGTNLGER